jgi:hypothetical protein
MASVAVARLPLIDVHDIHERAVETAVGAVHRGPVLLRRGRAGGISRHRGVARPARIRDGRVHPASTGSGSGACSGACSGSAAGSGPLRGVLTPCGVASRVAGVKRRNARSGAGPPARRAYGKRGEGAGGQVDGVPPRTRKARTGRHGRADALPQRTWSSHANATNMVRSTAADVTCNEDYPLTKLTPK